MSLFRRAMMAAAGASAPPPLTLPTANLLAVWDPRRADLITEAGTGVSSWLDIVASAPATQGTDASRPTLNPTGLNGKPTIDFNGTSDFLNVTLSAASGPRTVYIVGNFDLSTAADMLDIATGRWIPGSDGGFYALYNNGWRRSTIGVSAESAVLTFRSEGANSEVWRGTTYGGLVGGGAERAIGGAITMGRRTTPSNYAKMGVALLAIYNAADDAAARQAVWDYATQEWGV